MIPFLDLGAAYRELKSHLDPIWHSEWATEAESTANWYAATFHRAWEVKASADRRSPAHAEKVKSAYAKLRDTDPDIADLLSDIVAESLALAE